MIDDLNFGAAIKVLRAFNMAYRNGKATVEVANTKFYIQSEDFEEVRE